MKNKAYLKYLLVILPVLLFACQSGVTDIEKVNELDPEIEKLKQTLVENGFPSELIQAKENYFLIDKDIIIEFDDVEYSSSLNKSKSTLQPHALQAHTPYLVNLNNVDDPITIKLDSSIDGVSYWEDAVSQAISHWNNIPNTRIAMIKIESGTADIIIYGSSSPNAPASVSGYRAIASFPSGGNPGSYIVVNEASSYYGGTTSVGIEGRGYVLTHELGHTIGFRHTNWASLSGESSAPTIPFTPSTDVSSVMNGNDGAHVNGWSGFSYYDNIAARVLYPSSYSAPPISVIFDSETSSTFTVSFDFDYSYAYGMQVYYKHNPGNWTYATTIYYPNDNVLVTVPSISGTIGFKIRRVSYHGSLYSPYSLSQDFVASGGGGGCQPGLPC